MPTVVLVIPIVSLNPLRGPFNAWCLDQAIPAQMEQNEDGKQEVVIMAAWSNWGYDAYYCDDADGDVSWVVSWITLLLKAASVSLLPFTSCGLGSSCR